MSIVELLEQYNQTEQAVLARFPGFVPGWREYKLLDRTNVPWALAGWSTLAFTDGDPFTEKLIEEGKKLYLSEYYVGRGVWQSDDKAYTLVIENTRTDGNVFLTVLDNTKRCYDPVMLDLITEW